MNHAQAALGKYGAIVITGGSSGIGKALLEAALEGGLSGCIANLSRSEPRVKPEGTKYKHFRCDLSDSSDLAAVFPELQSWIQANTSGGGLLLINNSGFGCYGDFPEPSLPQNLAMIDLNIRALVDLTGRLLPEIIKTQGGVVHIASTAAFQPLAYMSAYAATKAFVLHWGLALHQELKGHGAFCLTLCPGPTSTEFFTRAGFEKSPVTGMGQTCEQVVKATFSAIRKRRSLRISGWHNWLLAGAGSLPPRRWAAPIAARLIQSLRLERFRNRPQ